MLSEALFELKEKIDNNSEADMEKIVDEINEQTGVEKDLLTMFSNLFVERILLAEKDNIPLEEREVKDWMRPEIEIIMLYMDTRKKYEKTGVKESFSNLAELLGKTALGVQYKYYDQRKILKNPKLERGKRGRKPKVAEKETKKEISIEEPELSLEETEKRISLKDRNRIPSAEEVQNDQRLDNQTEDSGGNNEMPTFEVPDTKELDMIQMLSGMINNFKSLSNLTGDKDNKNMKHIVEGIYMLSSIAASNMNDASQTKMLKDKLEKEKQEKEQLNEAMNEIKNDYKVLADKIQTFQNSSDTDKITNLYSFLEEVEKEISQKAYVSPLHSYSLDSKGHVVGVHTRS